MKHPLILLAQLQITKQELNSVLIAFGRELLGKDPGYRTTIEQRCALADNALQGRFGANELVWLEKNGIASMQELWNYRQFLGALIDYKAGKKYAWLETERFSGKEEVQELNNLFPKLVIQGFRLLPCEPLSPLELCASIGFGHGLDECVSRCINKILAKDPVQAENLVYAAEETWDEKYGEFLRQQYPEFTAPLF